MRPVELFCQACRTPRNYIHCCQTANFSILCFVLYEFIYYFTPFQCFKSHLNKEINTVGASETDGLLQRFDKGLIFNFMFSLIWVTKTLPPSAAGDPAPHSHFLTNDGPPVKKFGLPGSGASLGPPFIPPLNLQPVQTLSTQLPPVTTSTAYNVVLIRQQRPR